MWQTSRTFFTLVTILLAVSIPRGRAGEPKKTKIEPEKLGPRAIARLGNTAFAHADFMYAVALAPGGKLAATVGTGEFVRNDLGEGQWNFDRLAIQFWDIPTGQPLRQIPVPEGPATALDFSPDGNTLIAAAGKKVFVWDVATGKETQRIPLPFDAILARFTADGTHLLISVFDRKAVHWEIVRRNLKTRTSKTVWHSRNLEDDMYIPSLDLSSDGARIGILLAKYPDFTKKPVVERPPYRVEVLDLATGKLLFEADRKELGNAIAFAPDGKAIGFGSDRLEFWDIASNKKVQELAPVPMPPPFPSCVPLPSAIPYPMRKVAHYCRSSPMPSSSLRGRRREIPWPNLSP